MGKVGTHLILELLECNSNLINDRDFIAKSIKEAILHAKATLLNYSDHVFTPQGVTSLALLSESHISFHSYPEYSYAAVDIFTCGGSEPEKALEFLIQAFESKTSQLIKIDRGTDNALQSLQQRELSLLRQG